MSFFRDDNCTPLGKRLSTCIHNNVFGDRRAGNVGVKTPRSGEERQSASVQPSDIRSHCSATSRLFVSSVSKRRRGRAVGKGRGENKTGTFSRVAPGSDTWNLCQSPRVKGHASGEYNAARCTARCGMSLALRKSPFTVRRCLAPLRGVVS